MTTAPPIEDYGLIGDCHTAALVSTAGSIDWCCLPRFDSASVFGRLLDWDRGGHCSFSVPGAETTRSYVGDTLVLETVFRAREGEARLLDFFSMREGGREDPRRQLVRIVEGVRGRVEVRIDVVPRFDYGEVRPWIRQVGDGAFAAIGGDDGLLLWSDAELEPGGRHALGAGVRLDAGRRLHLSMQWVRPELVDDDIWERQDGDTLDRRLEETMEWWRAWGAHREGTRARLDDGLVRSALVLKALTHAPTGAMVAAPTTSLPEVPGGERNWDYRHSWIRDSTLAARALTALGHHAEADGFRRFIERSAAGSADELQIMFGVGGERRLGETTVDSLRGYRRSRPVRVGNAAHLQQQHDVFGQVLDLAWHWHERGHSPDDDHWEFLCGVVDRAAEVWERPDRGIWEVRSRPQHFVHSKVMCWTALDRGIRLAEDTGREAPVRRWRSVRGRIRRAVEHRGYDSARGVFVRRFGGKALDAALLLLPRTGFVRDDDDRMVRTVDAIRHELQTDGLLFRYRSKDGIGEPEGAFVAASFWLAECLARQGRIEEARAAFDRASGTGNDLGLFSEEYDPRRRLMLGNFPQGLSHLSAILAALALE